MRYQGQTSSQRQKAERGLSKAGAGRDGESMRIEFQFCKMKRVLETAGLTAAEQWDEFPATELYNKKWSIKK